MATSSAEFRAAVASDDPRAALSALRDRLAAEVAAAEGCHVATLSRVLLDTIKTLEKLPRPKSGRTIEDELREMREARKKTATGEPRVNRWGGREPEKFPRRSGDPKKQS